MKAPSYVKVTKISSLPGRPAPLDEGYWVIGQLIDDIAIDKPINVWRLSNSLHPKGRAGHFMTSVITSVLRDHVEDGDGWLVQTSNSIYRVTELAEEQAYGDIDLITLPPFDSEQGQTD